MAYTVTSLDDLTATLTALLSDPTNVFWTQAEIQLAIAEALREWSGATSYWRERGSFNLVIPASTSPPTFFYDLSVQMPVLRGRTITYAQLLTEIQLHFYEPGVGTAGTNMTAQFDVDSILAALVRARNRFVLDARMPLAVPDPFAVGASSSSGLVTLDEDIVYLHRASWKDADGVYSPIFRSDSFARDAEFSTITGDRPVSLSQAQTMPLQIDLYPPPANGGSLELVVARSVVDTPAAIIADPTITLRLPDDFCHAVKYAAMADLLSMDSKAGDDFRADYCDFRYRSILGAAAAHRSILRVLRAGTPLGLVPLYSLDSKRPSWHQKLGTPDTAGVCYDLLAFAPPARVVTAVTCDVARTAPVPATGTDPIQLGQEELDSIINYCQHYLSLKLGGAEFQQTFSQFDQFQRAAAYRNEILANQARYLVPLFGQPKWEQARQPDANEGSVPNAVTAAPQPLAAASSQVQ